MVVGWLMAAKANEEVIKDLQDKVISIQDHQISFLNDSIGNIIGIAAIVQVVIAAAIGFMSQRATRKTNQAEEKMKEAEEKIREAIIRMEQADDDMAKVTKMEERLEQLNNLIEDRMRELDNIKNITIQLVKKNEEKIVLAQTYNKLEMASLLIHSATDKYKKTDLVARLKRQIDMIEALKNYPGLSGKVFDTSELERVEFTLQYANQLKRQSETITQEVEAIILKYYEDFPDQVNEENERYIQQLKGGQGWGLG